MAVKQVRNIIRTQLENAIKKAEQEAINEGKKKLSDIQNKIPTPETIIKKLQTSINAESCSAAGDEKFKKIVKKTTDVLTTVNDKIGLVKESIDSINEVVEPISEGSGPLSSLKNLATSLKSSLIPALDAIVLVALAQLIANSGPTSSGSATEMASSKKAKAEGKKAQFLGLILTINFAVKYYINKALKVLKILEPPKKILNIAQEKVVEAIAVVKYMELDYLEGCDKLTNANNPDPNTEQTSLFTNPFTDNSALEVHLGILETKYNDLYNQLKESGNEKYIERLYTIREDLTENYNISFKTKTF
jgi:hypothetical protein